MQHSFAVAMSLLAFGLTSSATAKEALPPDPGLVSQTMLDALLEQSSVPGLSAAVWKGGAIIWTGTAGMRDVEAGLPVTADTRFRLASVSKLFTVTAAARLAQEGKLDLDAPVTTTLPWLNNAWPAINARQLAAHTSGMPHYQDVDQDRGAVHYPDGRAAVNIFADRPLLAPPGEAYSYSSWAYTLLGAMVEQASGIPFPSYISGTIAPGMAVGADGTDKDPLASHAYDLVDGRPVRAAPHDFSYTWGGGGLMGSAPGVARFGGAMIENRIVSAATFDRMLQPMLLNSGKPAGDDGYEVGFGWRVGRDGDGKPIAFHNGTAIGARSSLVLWRDESVAASILSNAVWTSSIDRTAEMLAAPFRVVPALPDAPCPTHARSYAGEVRGDAVSGEARFSRENGICTGQISLPSVLIEHFSNGPQPAPERMKIVGIDGKGGLSRAGLVTAYGIYDLRANADGSFTASLSASRKLTIRFAN